MSCIYSPFCMYTKLHECSSDLIEKFRKLESVYFLGSSCHTKNMSWFTNTSIKQFYDILYLYILMVYKIHITGSYGFTPFAIKNISNFLT